MPEWKEPVMSFPHERPYRRRTHYQFRTELSGLERPRQWLRMVLSVVAALLAMMVIAFVAFG